MRDRDINRERGRHTERVKYFSLSNEEVKRGERKKRRKKNKIKEVIKNEGLENKQWYI